MALQVSTVMSNTVLDETQTAILHNAIDQISSALNALIYIEKFKGRENLHKVENLKSF
jgi:hypothetical protein